MVKRIIGLCLLLVLVTIFLFPLHPAAGQDNREVWSSPRLLGSGWWQSIATDMQGGVHVAWYGIHMSDDGAEHDMLTYSYLPLNGSWTPPNDVIYTGDGGFTVRNSVATTSDGMLEVALKGHYKHEFAKAPVGAASVVANWSDPIELDPGGYYVDMASDNHDVLHFVYSGGADISVPRSGGNPEGSLCPGCGDLFYRRSTDEGTTWSDSIPISDLPNTGSDRMDIFQGQSGRMFIDWDEGIDWVVGSGKPQDVRIVYSDDEGITWSKPIILKGAGDPDNRPIQIAATEMRNKVMLAVWRYSTDRDRNIYFQISQDDGATWTDPKAIGGLVARSISDTPLDDYELVTDKLGVVHLFAVGQPNTLSLQNPTLYHITYQQGIWTAPFPVFYSPQMWPEWPKASLGLQNDIHLSWFTRGIREDLPLQLQSYTGDLKIYYSHLTGNLPLQATPQFRPTETLLPTATVFQNIEPTITAFPTLEKYTTDLYMGTQDTYGANTLLGGILAAGLFCAGIIIALRILRR